MCGGEFGPYAQPFRGRQNPLMQWLRYQTELLALPD
ncbi:hypothetical protein BCAR13_80134 [Paraburkholderia caribensis]|nr:hypothetical protein BCAR13_80134 [Paraburkholderia caribensis]